MPYRGNIRDRYGRRYDQEDRFTREDIRGLEYDREDRQERTRDAERGFFDRAGDEVRSWFGDEEAERRRRMERGGRFDRDDPPAYRRRSYGESASRERPYDREEYYDENAGSYGRGRRSYGGPDPDDISLYGERTYPESRTATRSYRGQGPRGYRRADPRIWEDINDALTEDEEIDALDIEVLVNDGDVTLSGVVEDRWTKRRVEDVVENVAGVRDVINQLRVHRPGQARAEAQPGRQFLNIDRDINGKAVLRSGTGEKLGEVSDVIIHPTEGTMLGLTIRMPDGQVRALVARDFMIGNDAVMATEDARIDEEGYRSVIAGGVPASGRIVGANVVTEDGNMIGRVSEAYLATETQRVIYRVAESRLKQLFGGGFFLTGNAVRAFSPDGGRIIVPAETEHRYAASSINEALDRMGRGADRRTDTTAGEPPEPPVRSKSTTTQSS